MIQCIRKTLSGIEISDLIFMIGSLFLFIGCYQIYPPSAFVITGALYIALAYLVAPPKKPVVPPVTK